MTVRLALRLAILPVMASVSGGCVAAAALPVAAAAGVIGKRVVTKDQPVLPPRTGAQRASSVAASPQPAPMPPALAPQSASDANTVPPEMQFLYGSGEAAALSIQAYTGLSDYVRARTDDRLVGQKLWSVVLDGKSTLTEPALPDCAPDQPLAIILDVDETTVLNLGFESDAAKGNGYSPQRWDAWERTGGADIVPVPGVVAALNDARAKGVTVIFNTNRSSANAAATEQMLDAAGLGPAVPGETLFTKGEGVHGKDARRAVIAKHYCVIAMAGDQLGDFTDMFDDPLLSVAQRRAAVTSEAFSPLWGRGWFILPNPVYGTGLKGKADDVFPADKRWAPPESPVNAGAQP